jgi:competence protein CoiA
MKFALVDRMRREAEPNLSGICPVCGSHVIAKCGETRVRHWAHRSITNCDHWWEPETEWHRNWKNRFSLEWQEVVQRDANGEKHVADVKTANGRVIEFQHSRLKPAERRAREAFYGTMCWMVNGLRRVRDKSAFDKALIRPILIPSRVIRFLIPVEGCSLLEEWSSSSVVVLFDFGGEVLWHLSPKRQNSLAVLTPVPFENFVHAMLSGSPIQGVPRQIQIVPTPRKQPTISPSYGFRRYSTYGRRSRRL